MAVPLTVLPVTLAPRLSPFPWRAAPRRSPLDHWPVFSILALHPISVLTLHVHCLSPNFILTGPFTHNFHLALSSLPPLCPWSSILTPPFPLLPMSCFLCLKALLPPELMLFFTYPSPAVSSLPAASSLLLGPLAPPLALSQAFSLAPESLCHQSQTPLSVLPFTHTTGYLSATKLLNSTGSHILDGQSFTPTICLFFSPPGAHSDQESPPTRPQFLALGPSLLSDPQ